MSHEVAVIASVDLVAACKSSGYERWVVRHDAVCAVVHQDLGLVRVVNCPEVDL